MKHAKKLLCLALALVMSLSLVACSSSSGDGGSSCGSGNSHRSAYHKSNRGIRSTGTACRRCRNSFQNVV